ncbi:MAG: CaiB/BaiF CoA transferase family protein [Acidimicrobiales bacterium]|jgi:crotonobetainyl-CoA:carnitine CoA-transferase CaiB-like acyl-CoA transferase
MPVDAPLHGIRIIECSALGPAAVTMPLVDLGAEVIKVEPPSGDYIREMTWPIVEGVSLMHLHINRGKRSIVMDLRTEEDVATFKELVKTADVVVEAMRPGGLARRGVGYEQLREVKPDIVFCTISGYGMTGPYRDLPAHGVAFDTWAGIVSPQVNEDGFAYLPEHASMGIHAGPLFGALGILAAVLRARSTGEGCFLEVAQSDAAAAMDWYRSETWRAYERPESEVTGNKADGYERREPGTGGMIEGVRYQVYETEDGRYVLFMASEQAFWRNFCEAVGRMDLFERWPGSKFADHARNNLELRRELRDIFRTRTAEKWIDFGVTANFPVGPVNSPRTIAEDPQFNDRFHWFGKEQLGADQLPTPLKFVGEQLPTPTRAPTVGEHTNAVLRDILGWDGDRIAESRARGGLGAPTTS